jgi:uncharacterized protein YukE
MSEAFVNPERLRTFANLLRGYSDVTANGMSSLQTQLQRLSSTWRDQEYQRFQQEFQKASTQLANLRSEIDKLIPALEADAQKAEAIHRSS